jgi:hypothetical protein
MLAFHAGCIEAETAPNKSIRKRHTFQQKMGEVTCPRKEDEQPNSHRHERVA